MPPIWAAFQILLQTKTPLKRAGSQTVDKPLSLSKNGVWGVAPRQVAGTPVPVFTPFPGERGFRQGCRNKDTPSFKHGCLQVVEQSRCRTHRQQTTTVAQRQSHQSVLKGIGIINQKFISKTDFFYNLRPRSKERGQLYVGFICLF